MHTEQEGIVGKNLRRMAVVPPVRPRDERLHCVYHPQSPVIEMKIIGFLLLILLMILIDPVPL